MRELEIVQIMCEEQSHQVVHTDHIPRVAQSAHVLQKLYINQAKMTAQKALTLQNMIFLKMVMTLQLKFL